MLDVTSFSANLPILNACMINGKLLVMKYHFYVTAFCVALFDWQPFNVCIITLSIKLKVNLFELTI